MAQPPIGMDLGTRFVTLALWDENSVQIIPFGESNHLACHVGFSRRDRNIGGKQSSVSANMTVFSWKRLLGRPFKDPGVQTLLSEWPFEVKEGPDKKPSIIIRNQSFRPEAICAMVIKRAKENAQIGFFHEIKSVVVTIPGCFNIAQRQSVLDACQIAGLTNVRLISEHMAAALAMILHLGAGFFDVCILNIGMGVFTVKAIVGDLNLGAEDFDTRVIKHIAPILYREYDGDLRMMDKPFLRPLRKACEEAKQTLSTTSEATISIQIGPKMRDMFNHVLTRSKFNAMCKDLIDNFGDHVQACLHDAMMDADIIDEVLLVGLPTRMPWIEEWLSCFFNGKVPLKCLYSDGVVRGAALQAARWNGMGSDELKNIVLFDATSVSLGIEAADGTMTTVIPRNTTFPVKKEIGFSVQKQPLLVDIYEGEKSIAEENNLLGRLKSSGMFEDLQQINVCFSLDESGILSISTESSSVLMEYDKNSLTKDEIEEIIKEAGSCYES